ncbi:MULTISPECIES: 2-oxoacid:acceptor oxidoreductase subunit alpha [Geobacillus]|jgi:2-oxoglutarate/2-oxoacid ferredoxin oxidoreductase subunit alpha|uniref:Pyruvate ferredoxin oxidoreductase, alpha subunit,putative n=4 Tax=Geobacillus thermodenitrificans TaxID=33940 RepID=A4IMH5_GEOTN|nr:MULTISPECIES: 2-oxoacid:acceptor oxidoreductase subunit alpha [Geobacillus]ABO66529.1 Pyruvate ferredoxin oxidoreductase, alpha subunit,putative [Geobacillus thermodenitrificans NG80-2]ARA97090.1 2-oxoglutarate ferredoxin oxidoreductase subunit alpha [Geobacillus thermodenitrificans]ARP42287.1 2-oxoglutarate synthase subunit KorA [Geobacillus thermodenitrificans]ATO36373.1 2-oxoglutarate ferredoxin oxidoreductase subunit alpha [Geobacillus thermodenitrificans]KQB93924.1 2-oxoglutarate ferre
MIEQLSWKVGGQQGEGIESTGEIFSAALNRLGYYLYGYRHFSSRIKGGHTNNKIRVSTKPVRAVADDLDILVAFDQETIDFNFHELHRGGIVIADAKFNPVIPEQEGVSLYVVPFTEIATELGNSLMKNMVAIGATSAVLGLDASVFESVVADTFARKGTQVVEKNMEAIRAGAQYMKKQLDGRAEPMKLAKADGKQRMFMIGNDAIALGALAGGARFMAAYPITPASEIMEYLIKKLPEFGGAVIQTEDEIAACTMAIGANYAGARAFTASAGPGLSLMAEAIGLAGMTETPLVVVDTQRGGPSTGLPTKQEQSDLLAMIYGTHGEIPKIVMAPSTVEEAFYDMAEALNLAEEYQCPVIFLSDLQLSLGKQTVEPLDYDRIDIRRGKLVTGELPPLAGKENFKRYELTPDGISPRVLPGTKHGIHHVTGVEHAETGRPSETAANRQAQMEKRMRKLEHVHFPTPVHKYIRHEEPDLLLVGFLSTRGAIEEAIERLEQDGVKVNHAHIRLLHPFPVDEMRPLVEKAKRVVVIEQNATGQLASLLKMNVGHADKMASVLKFDGNPFLPGDVYNKCKELLAQWPPLKISAMM